MHIKKLLRPRNILLVALFFTLITTTAFLMPSTKIPSVRINSPIAIDKLVHFGAHFVLVLSWLVYYVRYNANVKNINIIFISLSCIVYGIIIEVIQGMTKTRGSDVADVIANIIGTGLGVLVFLVLKSKIKMKT